MKTATRIHEIGPYAVEEVIGRGATAIVYRASHKTSGRAVALKVFSPGAIGQYQREIAVAPALHHPGLVRVLDHGIDARGTYIAYELVLGETLQLRMSGRVSAERAMAIAADVAAALAHLHRHGIIHADIKPANILIDEDGRARLIDYGSAQIGNGPGNIGTPTYMSPEQARGSSMDTRSDLYSLGVVLFEMLEGDVPFKAKHSIDVMLMHVEQPTPALGRHVPRQAANIVRRLMQKQASRRYRNGDDVIADLRPSAAPGWRLALPSLLRRLSRRAA